MQEPMKITVDNWYAAIQDLSEGREYLDFNFTAFNFKNRKGYHNKIWRERCSRRTCLVAIHLLD